MGRTDMYVSTSAIGLKTSRNLFVQVESIHHLCATGLRFWLRTGTTRAFNRGCGRNAGSLGSSGVQAVSDVIVLSTQESMCILYIHFVYMPVRSSERR